MIVYMSIFQPWLYYSFLFLASAVFWLRPVLVYIYAVLFGPAEGDEYLRVNWIYFPALWVMCVVFIVTFLLALVYVFNEGGAQHWFFMVLSGVFVVYLTFYLVILGGAPTGMLG